MTCLAGWQIVVAGNQPALLHAADELRFHLAIAGSPAGCQGMLTLSAGTAPSDGFAIEIADHAVTIAGDNPRGALNATYWLLEQLGFAWVEPGDRGICFRPATIAPGSYRQVPSFPTRTLTLGQDALHDDWLAWMEWASRNRLNDIFFHDTPPSRLDRGGVVRPATAEALAANPSGWMFERWDADSLRIRDAAAIRALTLQFGGHHLPALLPRDLFETHPEWFPLRGGQREPRYNLCVSSPAAERIQRAAAAFFQRFPGASVYHLWADDIRGGGWCECNRCRALAPSDQALAATNLVARVLDRHIPGARVAHLAYRDTLDPPSHVSPEPNVDLLWAPRERCYAHPASGDTCGRNLVEFWRPFAGLVDSFRSDRVRVFEYYSDAVLFKGLAPPHLDVLPADAAAYAAAGATNLQNLMVGDRPWMGPPWHAWWMARCAWDTSSDAARELRRFCAAAFPGNGVAMERYYGALENGYRLLLDRHDLENRPRHDVLDFADRPRETLARKAVELLEAAAIIAGAAAALAGLSDSDAAGAARLERERIQAAFTTAVAGHIAARTAAWDAALSGRQTEAASFHDQASTHLGTIAAWDERWNTPGYAPITSSLRRAMEYHLGEVRRLIAR